MGNYKIDLVPVEITCTSLRNKFVNVGRGPGPQQKDI